MVESYDAGSLPFAGDIEKFLEGAKRYGSSLNDSIKYFEGKVVEGLLDKVRTGIDVPNYPQFRDMNETFLEMIAGVEKVRGGYIETDVLSVKVGKEKLPEALAIRRFSHEIYEEIGEPLRLKLCVTGPYTLSSLFLYKDSEVFNRLGNVISRIVENNIFSEKHIGVGLVSVDEPVFGLRDDPLMDRGSEGRENLRRSWEYIFDKAKSKGAETCLHLHNTADQLFWEVKSLSTVESHADDPLYQSKKTKDLLESTDKFLKASICVVDFDMLIKEYVIAASRQKMGELTVGERVAEVWKEIAGRKIDPAVFLESVESMKERLAKIVERFGVERVPYAGPECGLRGFPTYECALECLRRVSNAVKDIAK